MKYIFLIINFITYFITIISFNKFYNKNIIIKSKLCNLCYTRPVYFNNSKKRLLKTYNNCIYINEKNNFNCKNINNFNCKNINNFNCKNINNFNNTKCIIFFNNETIDICFRGTVNYFNIYSNMQICLTNYNNIQIHNGFLDQYLQIKQELFTNIDNIIKNNNIKNISLSGHSSGGAIANIASIDFCKKYINTKITCVTFGSPKVGNNNFVKEYNKYVKDSYRIVNKNDIIEHLPLPFLYKHIHEPIYLEENKKITINDILVNIYKYFRDKHLLITYIKNLII
jgi:predicted lipase